MDMAILEIVIRKVEDKNGRMLSKKFMIVCCDQCDAVFERWQNIKTVSVRPRHYCGHACHKLAMKAGGIADESRKTTCREKYGTDYLIARSDIAKLASQKGNSRDARVKAMKSYNERLKCYSFRLTRGLTITRSKAEVEFLDALAIELGVVLQLQRYINGRWIDAYCAEYDCWIEFDGVYWHSKPDAVKRDKKLDTWFEERSLVLMRITDAEAAMPDSVRVFADRIRSAAAGRVGRAQAGDLLEPLPLEVEPDVNPG